MLSCIGSLYKRVKWPIQSQVGKENGLRGQRLRITEERELLALIECGTRASSSKKIVHQFVVKTDDFFFGNSSGQSQDLTIDSLEEGVPVRYCVHRGGIPRELARVREDKSKIRPRNKVAYLPDGADHTFVGTLRTFRRKWRLQVPGH